MMPGGPELSGVSQGSVTAHGGMGKGTVGEQEEEVTGSLMSRKANSRGLLEMVKSSN